MDVFGLFALIVTQILSIIYFYVETSDRPFMDPGPDQISKRSARMHHDQVMPCIAQTPTRKIQLPYQGNIDIGEARRINSKIQGLREQSRRWELRTRKEETGARSAVESSTYQLKVTGGGYYYYPPGTLFDTEARCPFPSRYVFCCRASRGTVSLLGT